ncbi:hypothetical protein B0O99DRAFT_670921 [Bisporella sp. PMI_857]|nr:hypothetical protein B0O99DRAFT_670921 [Bisporella sp. PMI_857]
MFNNAMPKMNVNDLSVATSGSRRLIDQENDAVETAEKAESMPSTADLDEHTITLARQSIALSKVLEQPETMGCGLSKNGDASSNWSSDTSVNEVELFATRVRSARKHNEEVLGGQKGLTPFGDTAAAAARENARRRRGAALIEGRFAIRGDEQVGRPILPDSGHPNPLGSFRVVHNELKCSACTAAKVPCIGGRPYERVYQLVAVSTMISEFFRNVGPGVMPVK